MIYTNKFNVPNEFCEWIKQPDYKQNIFNVSTFLQPPRAFAIKKNNFQKLQIDLVGLINSKINKIVSESLLNCISIDEDKGDFKNKEFTVDINNITISNNIDLFKDSIIQQYKNTTVYKFLKKDFKEYIEELSIKKWMLYKNGIQSKQHGIIYFVFNDWNKKDIIKEGYPQSKIIQYKIDLMTIEQTQNFINNKLIQFNKATVQLPLCSKEELWQGDSVFAVMKTIDSPRAIRVFNTKEEAQQFNSTNNNIIVQRKATAKRCEYCLAYKFCDQCKKMVEQNLVANINQSDFN